MSLNLKTWSVRLAEIAAAGILFVGVSSAIDYRKDAYKRDVQPTEWFTVNDIYVPDHEVGDNPGMIYDRTIGEDHRGFWVAEAQKQVPSETTVFFNECTGSGVADYETSDVIPGDTVTWEWFFGKPCQVPPGTYRIQLTRDMTKPDWPVKRGKPAYSNVFRVYPRGKMPN